MELCVKTLKDVMKQLIIEFNRDDDGLVSPIGYFIASELFIEILESVDFLHKHKVIHRDLKPTNILLTSGENDRFIKLSDFGLATMHEFDEQSHSSDKGTPKYMAPELFTRKYDTKSDIFSLGVLIQELYNFDINK
jgi:serine/threonine protein kinase